MCCSCMKTGCKCLKWFIIIVLLAVLLALIVAIIIIATALHGSQTLQSIFTYLGECITGQCKYTSGAFYNVMKNFVNVDTYHYKCNGIERGTVPATNVIYEWKVEFEMAEDQTLGIWLNPTDGYTQDDMLEIRYDFFATSSLTMPSSFDTVNIKLHETIINPESASVTLLGDWLYGDYAGDMPSEMTKCAVDGVCTGQLFDFGAHMVLKFRRVPEWLCFRMNTDSAGVVKFVNDLGKKLGKVSPTVGDWVSSITESQFNLPAGLIEGMADDEPMTIDTTTGADDDTIKETCFFSTWYLKADTTTP